MKYLFIILGICLTIVMKGQNFDRITISAGGSATDNVSYTIGETFNLAIAKDGNIKLETGMQGSTSNTGGDNNFLKIETVISNDLKLACYPNPAKDVLYFTLSKQTKGKLFITITNTNGQIVFSEATEYRNMMDCNIKNLQAGSYILSVSSENKQAEGKLKFVKI